MKISVASRRALLAAGLVLGLSGTGAIGQTAENPQTFDVSKGSWVIWNGWGMQGWMLEQDPALDAAGDPNSGSLRYEIPFVGERGEQVMTFGTLGNRWAWDGGVVVNTIGAYKTLSLDLKVDPASAPTVNGTYGNWEFGLTTDGWGQVYLPAVTIPLSATNWTHIEVPLDPTKSGAEKANGFFVKLWSDGAFTNTFVMNIDNVWIEPATNTPPPPPPTMTLQKAAPGLNFIAAGTGQYDRQNVRLLNPDYSWIGKGSTPVSYSFDVTSFPGTANPGFEVHSYLIPVPPDPGTIGTGSSPDWDQPTAIFMDLQNQADGSATWTFRWKTNTPGSNGTFYDGNVIPGTLSDPAGPLGTWKLTFQNDTSVTMTSPGGLTTNFVFAADNVAAFKDDGGNALPLYYYIGAKPQQNANIGLSAALSKASVEGVATPVQSDFLKEGLDTNIWELAAQSGAGVQAVPTNALLWLSWTLPDIGFSVQGTSSLTNQWTDLDLNVQTVGGTKRVLLTPDNVGSTSMGFFRLIQRPFVKLQVLLPGETAAPGTPTGKTGTPEPQIIGVPFNVVVNAVDETWRKVPTAPSDEIALTSSDENSTMPANATLAGGARSFSVTLLTEGTFTITASDATDNTKTASTSAPVTVTP